MVKSQWRKRLNQIDILLWDIPFVIAGGFPRDIHFGAEPKDIDVWVEYTSEIGDKIIKALEVLEVNFVSTDCQKIAQSYGNMGALAMEQLITFPDVDIIIVKRPINDVCSKFDYNINQFIWELDEPVYVGKSDLKYLLNTKPLDEIPEVRIQKMLAKFRLLVQGDDGMVTDARTGDNDYMEITSDEDIDEGLQSFLMEK